MGDILIKAPCTCYVLLKANVYRLGSNITLCYMKAYLSYTLYFSMLSMCLRDESIHPYIHTISIENQ